MNLLKIGIIGIGVVGTAMMNSFNEKGYITNKNLFIYDKYKNIGDIDEVIETDLLFLALPTLYDEKIKSYDLLPITDTLEYLLNKKYNGLVIIKSTMEPKTTEELYNKYKLDIIHNPEFLTARTASQDFHNQKHIILGHPNMYNKEKFDKLYNFYQQNYPFAEISVCNSNESESMKLFVNNFYAVKVQFFTELYLLCQKMNVDYDIVKGLMLKNGWIHPQHTTIPGPDGQISYGGMCFPKDTQVLMHCMEKYNTPHTVLENTIYERNIMRE